MTTTITTKGTTNQGASAMTTTTKNIKCGNCKGTHHSSQEVRACYDIAPATSTFPGVAAGGNVQASSGAMPISLATDKQVDYIEALLTKREHGIIDTAMWLTGIRTSKAAASAAIKFLIGCDELAMPQPAPSGSYPKVPGGYYAIDSATGNNDLDFFCVQIGKVGTKWEGFPFVKRVVGGHPEFSVQGQAARKVLERILDAGVDGAAALYGQEIGRCGICNRTLTDEASRAAGIGPVCRQAG